MAGRESAAVQSALAAVVSGESVLEAARQHRCSPSSVHRAMRRHGLPHLRSLQALRGAVGPGDVSSCGQAQGGVPGPDEQPGLAAVGGNDVVHASAD